MQIFLDFDGYSLCAIGIALCFGFAFPDNFRFPFGACLIIERLLKRPLKKINFGKNATVFFLLTVLTFFATTLTAGFFRAPGLGHALAMYRNIFTLRPAQIELYYQREAVCAVAVIVGIFLFHWLMRDSSLEKLAARIHWAVLSFIIALMLIANMINPGGSRAFVYFQF